MITEKRRLELHQEGLLALAKQKEPKFTDIWFPYTSGEIGNYYIQSIAVENDGQDYHNAINAVCEIIEGTIGLDGFDAIAGGETRDWDFSNPVAYALKKPHIKLYKEKKPIGLIKDKRVILVPDLNNEGSSIRDYWVPQIKDNGGEVVHVYPYVERMEDGLKVLEELKIPSDAVVPFDGNAWTFLMDKGIVTTAIYDSLMDRLKDKRAWAHNALRLHTGKLEEMLKDEKTRKKGEKILNVGYPELKEELLEKMKVGGYEHQFS